MESRKNELLELVYNTPRQWHFDALVEESGISRPQVATWLRRFQEQGIIQRICHKGKMPYYVQDTESASFRTQKKQYGYQKLIDVGLIDHLASLKKANVVVLFGSFARWDWYIDSDIDVFIYGSDEDFAYWTYKRLLRRDIQIHLAKGKQDLKSMRELLPYILEGQFIKGSIEDLGITIHV